MGVYIFEYHYINRQSGYITKLVVSECLKILHWENTKEVNQKNVASFLIALEWALRLSIVKMSLILKKVLNFSTYGKR